MEMEAHAVQKPVEGGGVHFHEQPTNTAVTGELVTRSSHKREHSESETLGRHVR